MTTQDPTTNTTDDGDSSAPSAAEATSIAAPSTSDFAPAEPPPPSEAHASADDDRDSADDARDASSVTAHAESGVALGTADSVLTGEQTAEGAESKARKRRRRRRKKKDGEGVQVEGAEGEPGAEGAEGEAEGSSTEGVPGEGGERRKKDRQPRREPPAFRVGEEVFARVERVTEDAILVDIAGKAQGLFDRRELESDQEVPGEGDQFVSTVASIGIRGGMVRVSKAPLPIDAAKTKVEEAMKAKETVDGFVTGAVRGGVEVDVDGLRAFAPASHVDLHPGGDLSHLVGRRFAFDVLSFEKKGRDVVLSRRRFLEADAQKLRDEVLGGIEAGSTQKAIVRSVKQWGVFVALPEHQMVEGLVPREEACHDRAARLEDQFRPGDLVQVRVLRVENQGGRKKLWLSRKAATEDPWEGVAQKYSVGTRHTGKIARLQPFGAFVELEQGIDGLIHLADISFKPVQHPKDVVKEGETIDVVVVTSDPSMRRIALHPAPPADEAEYPRQRVGPQKSIQVAVVAQSEAGLIVRVLGSTGRQARGFIPASHTGKDRGADLRKDFPTGTKLEAKVIEVDTRRGEVKLSIRALKDDAEKQAYSQYREGVARDSKFGTFADLMKK